MSKYDSIEIIEKLGLDYLKYECEIELKNEIDFMLRNVVEMLNTMLNVIDDNKSSYSYKFEYTEKYKSKGYYYIRFTSKLFSNTINGVDVSQLTISLQTNTKCKISTLYFDFGNFKDIAIRNIPKTLLEYVEEKLKLLNEIYNK